MYHREYKVMTYTVQDNYRVISVQDKHFRVLLQYRFCHRGPNIKGWLLLMQCTVFKEKKNKLWKRQTHWELCLKISSSQIWTCLHIWSIIHDFMGSADRQFISNLAYPGLAILNEKKKNVFFLFHLALSGLLATTMWVNNAMKLLKLIFKVDIQL